jgi:hypothetical protein
VKFIKNIYINNLLEQLGEEKIENMQLNEGRKRNKLVRLKIVCTLNIL